MNARIVEIDEPSLSRRHLFGAAAAMVALPFAVPASEARAESIPLANGIKAMTFDIQGTVLDYYRPFVRVSAAIDARKGQRLDWTAFLADWNAGASSIIQAIIDNRRSWMPPVRVFREALDGLLAIRGRTTRLDEADRLELMSVWSQMSAWPDSVEGIVLLKRRVTVAALSNAGMAGVIALSKRAGLPFDAVLTGELVHAYKPAPEVYHAAAAYLGFAPDEIMMVAAHKPDLKGAKAAGMKTAYIPRPFEIGPETKVDRSPESFIDIMADNLIDLAKKVGP